MAFLHEINESERRAIHIRGRMTQITLNADQFRELIAGRAVVLGCCEIRLGDVGFEFLKVNPITALPLPTNHGIHIIKAPK